MSANVSSLYCIYTACFVLFGMTREIWHKGSIALASGV